MPTVRDVVHEYLRAREMTTVYGNPGSTELGFLTDWPGDFRYVTALNEAAAVAMADGHSQITRGPVLVNLHSAAGLGNAMGSIVSAHANQAALVLLVGQQERALLPRDPFLAATAPESFGAPYVKWAVQPALPADVPAALDRAVRHATQPPYGPVVVSVPNDDWAAEAPPVEVRPLVPGYGPSSSALDDLAIALQNSRRPAFVVGAEVDRDNAVLHVVSLAEVCGAAVFAAPMASRCSFPEDHRQFVAHLPASPGPLAEALQWYDLVVVLGGPAFTVHLTSAPGPELPPIIVVSNDDRVLTWAPGTTIRSTMVAALVALTGLIVHTLRPASEPRRRAPTPAMPTGGPLTAAHVLAALARDLPSDAVVVEEIPSHRGDLHDFLPIVDTDTGLLTTGGGVLGYAVPAAIGAGLAAPHRPIVALVGDGSLLYTVQALWTAVRHHVPITVIVLDNKGYGALRSIATAIGATSVPGLDIDGLDPVLIARGLGCRAVRIDTAGDLADALADAFARSDGPCLLHVPVDDTVNVERAPNRPQATLLGSGKCDREGFPSHESTESDGGTPPGGAAPPVVRLVTKVGRSDG